MTSSFYWARTTKKLSIRLKHPEDISQFGRFLSARKSTKRNVDESILENLFHSLRVVEK